MKLRSWLLLICFVALFCFNARAKTDPSAEDAVRAIAARETAAWIKFDSKEVASLYTADAIWQNPFGVRLHGSVELEKFLDRLFQRPGYRAAKDTNAARVVDIRFPSPAVAVMWSEESSEGQIDDESGKPMLPCHSWYLQVFVKKDGGWKISECIIMDELHHP